MSGEPVSSDEHAKCELRVPDHRRAAKFRRTYGPPPVPRFIHVVMHVRMIHADVRGCTVMEDRVDDEEIRIQDQARNLFNTWFSRFERTRLLRVPASEGVGDLSSALIFPNIQSVLLLLLLLLPSITLEVSTTWPHTMAGGVPSPKASSVLPVLQRIAAQQGDRGRGWQEASVSIEEEGLGIQEFWSKYQEPNRPVIVKGITRGWRAAREWVVTDDNGGKIPNFSLLKDLFGDDEVCAARCAEKHFSDQKREEMRMRDFFDCWQAGQRSEDLLYVKDWHFARLHRDYNAYECPEIFSEDWLNRWYDARDDADDYRFCYMGRQGTWTPLHRDVLRSYR